MHHILILWGLRLRGTERPATASTPTIQSGGGSLLESTQGYVQRLDLQVNGNLSVLSTYCNSRYHADLCTLVYVDETFN